MAIPLEVKPLVKPKYKYSTLSSWLGDKANNIWNINISPYLGNFIDNPWPPLTYCPPTDTLEVRERNHKLHEDLAALSKGTVLMGRPKRTTPPKYGVITRQQCAPASRSPTAHAYHAENKDTPQVAKQTHASFEVKTSSSALPAELAELYASLAPLPVQPFDDDGSDENKPPLVHLSKEEKPNSDVFDGVAIPEARLRTKREPFGVLYYAENCSDAKAKTGIVKLEDGGCIESTSDGTSSPCGLEGGVQLKGLMRLRAKAPPPIDMTLVKTAIELEKRSFISNMIYDSTISTDSTAGSRVGQVKTENASTVPNAPMMLNVPLPPITPIEKGTRVTTIPALTLSIPTVRYPRMPLTPKRQALLDILIGDSSYDTDKSISKGEEI